MSTEQEVARLGPTMHMGEAALAGLDACRVTVRATTMVDLLMLQRSDAVRVLGPEFLQLVGQTQAVTKRQVCHWLLTPLTLSHPLFKVCPSSLRPDRRLIEHTGKALL